jgi:hypothetical protein
MEAFKFGMILNKMNTRKEIENLIQYLNKTGAPSEYISSALSKYFTIPRKEGDRKWQDEME